MHDISFKNRPQYILYDIQQKIKQNLIWYLWTNDINNLILGVIQCNILHSDWKGLKRSCIGGPKIWMQNLSNRKERFITVLNSMWLQNKSWKLTETLMLFAYKMIESKLK